MPAPLARPSPRRRWLRLLLAFDPGLIQISTANRTACSIALALVAEWVFVSATHALQVPVPLHAPPAVAASVANQHHEVLVVAMLLGGLVANLQGINGNEPTLTSQLVTILYIGAAVSASLTFGLAIGPHRDVALVVMVVLLVAGSAGRRFGQRGAVTGLLLFVGYFYGFFLSPGLGISAAGWLSAEVGLATAATMIVRLALFRPSPTRDLRLAMATYDARVKTVLSLAARAAVSPRPRTERRLWQWLVRLGEAALIVDARLASGTTSPAVADEIHRRTFDTEVAVTNLARFAEMFGRSGVPGERLTEVRQTLTDLADGDLDAARSAADAIRTEVGGSAPPPGEQELIRWVVQHRYANALDDMADALARWPSNLRGIEAEARSRTDDAAEPAFNPAVALRGGMLPGSADVSAEASTLPGTGVRLAPYVRTAAQMAVAVSVAILAGDALDARRFYWAVVAALLALVGTNTVAEQLRKAAYRIAGTLVGVVAGTALVDAIGHHSVWSLVTVVVVMWLGVAFMRANYALLAMAVTISLSQAYLSLGEFSNGLLWERLAETAVGAAAAMLTVVVVVPLRTRRVLNVALARLVESVADLAGAAVGVLAAGGRRDTAEDSGSRRAVGTDVTSGVTSGATGDAAVGAPGKGDPANDLRAASRAVDGAFQALVATAQPLRLVGWTESADRVSTQVRAATAARHYARNLVVDAQRSWEVDPRLLDAGRRVLCQSAQRLAAHLRGQEADAEPTFLRAASLFAEADRSKDGWESYGAEMMVAGDFARPTELETAGGGIGGSGRNHATDDRHGGGPPLAIRDLVLLDGALAALAASSGLTVERLTPAQVVAEGLGESTGGATIDD